MTVSVDEHGIAFRTETYPLPQNRSVGRYGRKQAGLVARPILATSLLFAACTATRRTVPRACPSGGPAQIIEIIHCFSLSTPAKCIRLTTNR